MLINEKRLFAWRRLPVERMLFHLRSSVSISSCPFLLAFTDLLVATDVFRDRNESLFIFSDVSLSSRFCSLLFHISQWTSEQALAFLNDVGYKHYRRLLSIRFDFRINELGSRSYASKRQLTSCPIFHIINEPIKNGQSTECSRPRA